MRYLSVCSGIESATVAWSPLGWTPVAFSEIDRFPRAVLKYHYPDVPLHGDFTKLRDEPWIVNADVLVGGTPCQAFSVAGLRKSLDDDRGNLSLEFIRLADAIDDLRRDAGREPAWICWENVPGVLSTHDNAFGAFLGGLVGGESAIEPPFGRGWRGAGVVSGPKRVAAWRILDAQHFGVAQRRRRVFVLALGGAGAWRCADALLPIIESMSGHPAPRREAGERVAPTLAARTRGGGGLGTDFDCDGGLVLPQGCSGPTAPTLNAAFGSKLGLDNQHIDSGAGLFVAHTLRAEGFDASEDGTGRGTPLVPMTFAHQERAVCENPNAGGQVAVAFRDVAPALTSNYAKQPDNSDTGLGPNLVGQAMAVRRITPVEAERLQGFSDNYTRIPYRGKPAEACPDGPRYKALGNSMAVPVMRWIGERIQVVEEAMRQREAA